MESESIRMGEHGTPRIDTFEHIWFANDQLAVRFIEEIVLLLDLLTFSSPFASSN